MNDYTNDFPSNDFTPEPYNPASVASQASNTPRFGHTANFAKLFSSNPEEASDYLAGVIAAGILTLSFFVLWAIAIFILMCMGRKMVGFFSGRPFVVKTQGVGSLEAEKKGPSRAGTLKPSCSNRPTQVRICFLVAGFFVFLFAILLAKKGIQNLRDTVDVFQEQSLNIDEITTNATGILENEIKHVGTNATKARRILEEQLQGTRFCPADPTIDINIGQDIVQYGEEAITHLRKLESLVASEDVQTVAEGLKRVKEGNQLAYEASQTVDLSGWPTLVVVIPYTFVPFLLMVGTLMAMFNCSVTWYTAIMNWFLFPLFVIMIVIAWVAAGLMIVGAGANGDFCLPGGRVEDNNPDTTIYNIMAELEIKRTETVYMVVRYFVSQCTEGENPFEFMWEAGPYFAKGKKTIEEIEGIVNSTQAIQALAAYCGRTDSYAEFETAINSLHNVIDNFLRATTETLSLIACGTLVPLYVGAVYDGICTYSVSAVYWVFSSALIIGIFGMIMIMLRSSFKPTHCVDLDFENEAIQSDNGTSPEDVVFDGGVEPGHNGNYEAENEYDLSLKESTPGQSSDVQPDQPYNAQPAPVDGAGTAAGPVQSVTTTTPDGRTVTTTTPPTIELRHEVEPEIPANIY